MQFPPVDDAAELVALGGLGLVGVDDGVLLQDAGAAGGLGAGVGLGLGLGRAPGAQEGRGGRGTWPPDGAEPRSAWSGGRGRTAGNTFILASQNCGSFILATRHVQQLTTKTKLFMKGLKKL